MTATRLEVTPYLIVRTPGGAIRAFLDGRLDGLAIGGFYVEAPEQ